MNKELREELEKFFDEQIRPQISSHGGIVLIQDLKNGVLSTRLLGACMSCPAAGDSTRKWICEEVSGRFAQIRDVTVDQSISEDLLSQARAILRHAQ